MVTANTRKQKNAAAAAAAPAAGAAGGPRNNQTDHKQHAPGAGAAAAKKQSQPTLIARVLRHHGVVMRANENALTALRRHAYQQQWSDDDRKVAVQRLKKAVAHEASAAFNSLPRLNAWLVAYHHKPQPSKKKAMALLKSKVFVNIYDLLAERYTVRFATVKELAEYTDRRRLYFPLKEAKGDDLRAFLQHLLHAVDVADVNAAAA